MALAEQPGEGALRDVELTQMRRRHLRRVLAIENRVYPRPWSMSLFLSELAQRPTRSYLVAKHAGEVVGYAGMMLLRGEAHITNIAVDPDLHGRKVGSRLLLALVLEAVARGAQLISLEVRVSNRAAQEMYKRFGFRVAGTRKGYYVETNEDAYVMVVEEPRSTDFRVRLTALRKGLDEGAS